MKIKIIKPGKKLSNEILYLVDELAKYEKLPLPTKAAKQRLLNDIFSKKPIINVLLAKADDKYIGYAFYFYSYSSFLAKPTLYLEDIFILEEYRRVGAGKLFFKELNRIAKEKKCGRMEFIVLDWNKSAISFYNKLGIKELDGWKFFRKSYK
ncbi:MAG: GNAT family N-acetyltransferase [Ignavibacteria bacterium]|nr:GNAT family N-acetyltransferase [Ignavibacteria bacterium]